MQPIPPDRKPTILVVEVNPQIHRFIAENLAKNFKVIPAMDGRQGLEKALDTHPALIISGISPAIVGVTEMQYLSYDGKYADKEKYPLPFVIFLDLKLPYLDGLEVLNWIRSQPRLKSIVVVVLTGSDETRDHQKSLRARCPLLSG